jgi:hypothetical protein
MPAFDDTGEPSRPLSRHRDRPSQAADSRPSTRGQALVEFALVLPMLIVLLLGVADFARVFSAGIALEATSRDGAEVGALERLRNKPPPQGDPTFTTYYANLHRLVAQAACREARPLPNTTFQASDSSCPTMPAIRVCVHDDHDPLCGNPIPGFASSGAGCSHLTDPWSSTSGGATASYSVEVRICYQFTTLFNLRVALPMNAGLSLGNVWLQRTRFFVIDCPPGPVSAC